MLKHRQQGLVRTIIDSELPVLITGEAGNGKTHSVEAIAKELGCNFHSLSVGEQTTVSNIVGFIDANGKYKPTGFRNIFEYGGIFLLDEIDAGNPNVLLAINTAIANGFCEFPDAMVQASPDFRLVATANTFGQGGNLQYAGRNRLDKATLNRFAVVHWLLDEELEAKLIDNTKLHKAVLTARIVAKNIEGMLISQRTSIYMTKLLAAGLDIEQVMQITFLAPYDEHTKMQFAPVIREYNKVDPVVNDNVVVNGELGTIIGVTETGYRVLHRSGDVNEYLLDEIEVL